MAITRAQIKALEPTDRPAGPYTVPLSSAMITALEKRLKKRASKDYLHALLWIMRNDDTGFIEDGGSLSVTASLVADLYNVPDATVQQDLQLLNASLKGKSKGN